MKPRFGPGPYPSSFGFGLVLLLWVSLGSPGLAQQATPASPQTAASTPQPEVSSHDEATTFKVNVRLVVVRVVVRDAQGHAVGNLHKEDFELFDNHTAQTITQFTVEQPGNQIAREQSTSQPTTAGAPPAKAADLPERFVAYVVDDVHLEFEDIAHLRDAAEHHFAGLLPTDRAAIITVSGVGNLDFTDDRAQLHAALLRLQPRPVSPQPTHPCPYMNYYMADMIANKQIPDVILAAAKNAFHCTTGEDPNSPSGAARFAAEYQQYKNMAETTASGALGVGDQETRLSLGALKDAIRRLAAAPGQRSVVLLSPGFLTPNLEYEVADVIDKALHAGVIVGTLDARGLYVTMPGGDASGENAPDMLGAPEEGLYAIDAASADDQILSELANATGGIFFHNNNDLGDGLQRTAAAPEYYYVLGFAPQNLKFDGRFHGLKVTLKNPSKLTLQARKGYYAPKQAPNPEEEAKQEIEDALFSQEEMHDLPVQLHTQFFKASDTDARLAVLAHVDVKRLHFRKADGRNNNALTIASGLFDRNGTFITGMEKIVTMRLKDETLEHRVDSGVTVKTSFDVKAGSYLVRLVVRDAEGQLSAENGAVEIP
ncbi:MAG: VWA domain-containing protein [Terriglobales bacterium]